MVKADKSIQNRTTIKSIPISIPVFFLVIRQEKIIKCLDMQPTTNMEGNVLGDLR